MIADIKIDKIFPNPDQPRKDFDESKLEELASSIKQYGVLEPIVVTPRKDCYMIVAGERRHRASLLANLKKIPAKIIEANDALVEELALLENVQRQDLNPIEEGRAYQKLLKRYTLIELADKLGYRKTGPIEDRIALLKLKSLYQEMVIKGTLGAAQAYEIARLPQNKQDIVYQKIVKGELNTYNKLYSFVMAIIALENQSEIFALTPLLETEKESLKTFRGLITNIERFIRQLHEEDKLKHLEKTVLHTDITAERIDLIIQQLQKIRRTILVGDSLKKARKDTA